MHRSSSLANALSRYIEAKHVSDPEASPRLIGTVADINGTLTAIEDQTSNFNWKRLALAVAAKLGLEDYATSAPISRVTFDGLLSALQSLQTFPEDYVLQINAGTGACAIVIWAHSILGLNVAVRCAGKSEEEVVFGSQASINLLLNVGQDHFHEESVALMSRRSGDKLFELISDEDNEYIQAAQRHPLRGYATNYMSKTIPRRAPGAENMFQELLHIATAFAVCASEHIINAGSSKDGQTSSVPVSHKQKPVSSIVHSTF